MPRDDPARRHRDAGFGAAEQFFDMRAETWDRTLDLLSACHTARRAGHDGHANAAYRRTAIPLGRRTDCETVAAVVIWLALDAPDYITAERPNASGELDKD